MKLIQSMVMVMALALTIVASPVVLADQKQPSAHEVVQATTDRMMAIIDDARGYFDQDPERFYREIESVLDDVVDFDSFARGVMGPYASKKGYLALDTQEEKKSYKERMGRFSQVFKDGLVHTYAKGLLTANGTKIVVLPPKEGEDLSGASSVTVVQNIYGEAEKPYVVQYKMRTDNDGEWKLRNVTIEAVNLGVIYQSQFASAAAQYRGDIDRVIDDWSVDPTATSGTATASVSVKKANYNDDK